MCLGDSYGSDRVEGSSCADVSIDGSIGNVGGYCGSGIVYSGCSVGNNISECADSFMVRLGAGDTYNRHSWRSNNIRGGAHNDVV